MKSFDEWLDTTKLRGYMDENSLEAAWEEGQQSKQAEVDELRKRIDDAIYDLQHIESAMWEEQVEHVLMILKGNKDEN
jgi:broad-specificity NMP kinase